MPEGTNGLNSNGMGQHFYGKAFTSFSESNTRIKVKKKEKSFLGVCVLFVGFNLQK